MSLLPRSALERLEELAANAVLKRINRGIEKEGLRVDGQGGLARTPHPRALGSALAHPLITTDFSEALIELITPVTTSIGELVGRLEEVHRFVNVALGEELLWPTSMPCAIDDEAAIPIAHYGSSNIGRVKTIYRRGLSARYGSTMQTVAGIHFNFSMPEDFWPWLAAVRGATPDQDFRTRAYLGLIRNFQRRSWLLLYLFGASPAADASFVRGRNHNLMTWPRGGVYLPYATCLRMGELGYQSSAQRNLHISYNDLDSYIHSLSQALHISYPPYEALGLEQNGERIQLRTTLLQIENEFYSAIRPKRVARGGEKPLAALRDHGLEYVEVRCLDLDPYAPLGISAEQIHFLDLFLLHCLLADAPLSTGEDGEQNRSNQATVVVRGREPGVVLQRRNGVVPLRDWALEILDELQALATAMGPLLPETAVARTLEAQRRKVEESDTTPSARILADMEEAGQSHAEFALTLARRHRQSLRQPPDANTLARLTALSKASLAEQAAIEAADDPNFDHFLHSYLKY